MSSPTPAPDATTGPTRVWRVEDRIATACMAVLVAITAANVAVRYLTDQSFAWTEELSVATMVVMVFAGAAAAALRDSHLRVEALYAGGSERRRRWLRRLSGVCTALVFGVLGVLYGRTGWDEWRYGETTTGLDWPRWVFTAPLVVLCALVAWRALRSNPDRSDGPT
jgi:TRAP-type C4-dicarboxylate transport system permease small subunit